MQSIGQRPVSRRAAIKALLTASVALAILATAGQAFSRGPSHPYTVTARASLRTGPGPEFPSAIVIWPGTTLTVTGQAKDDFTKVHYRGMDGWIPTSLLAGMGSPDGDTVMVGEAYVAIRADLHSGPGDGFGVLRAVPTGSPLNVSSTVQNGFRYVVHDGLAGWLDEDAIAWRSISNLAAGVTMETTSDLNLRDEPTMTSTPSIVMPQGSTVLLLEGETNGYRRVSFHGIVGWASLAYLRAPNS